MKMYIKSRKTFITLLLLAASFVLWLHACDETSDEIDYQPNVNSSKDFIKAEDALFDIVNAFLKGIYDSLIAQNNYAYIDYCGVTYDPDENIMHFSYGAVNRMCQDGKFRRGDFYAEFDGPLFEPGVKANLITDSLFVNDSLVNANMTFTNLGLNAMEKVQYGLSVFSLSVAPRDSVSLRRIQIMAELTLSWDQGSSTPEIHEDDYYLVTGTASGISSDFTDFSVTIEEPLVDYVDCCWIISGTNLITVPSADIKQGTIDYLSDDGCNYEVHFYFNENFFYDYMN